MKRSYLILIVIALCWSQAIEAQIFTPDSKGYVANPKFHKLIRDYGYQLVGAFDTVSKKPLMVMATAIKDGKEIRINTLGDPVRMPAGPMPVRVNQVYGNSDGDIRIDAPVEDQKEMFEQANDNGKYGTRNKNTKKIGLPVVYDGMVWLGGGLVTIQQAGKMGIAKTDGTILLAPKYDNVSPFNNYTGNKQHFYMVWDNKKYGLLDHNFKEIIAPKYEYILDCYQCSVSDNLLIVVTDRKKGLLTKTGKELMPAEYDEIRSLNNKAPYLLLIGSARKYGIADTTGKVLMQPEFEHVKYLPDENILELDNGFHQGTADLKGNILLQPVYKGVRKLNGGMRLVEQNNKDGLAGKDGKLIIEPQYDHLFYNDNCLLAKKDGKFGLLDLKGKILIPLKYDDMGYNAKRIFFKEGGRFGIMDLSGRMLLKLDYDNVEFCDRVLIVTKNGKKGIADMQGSLLVPIKYDDFRKSYKFMSDGIAEAVLDGKSCLVDLYGNEFYR